MTKAKQFKTRIGGKTWRMESAILYLNDWSTSGGYNHPVLSLEFVAPDDDYPEENVRVSVGITFQRNRPSKNHEPVSGFMDTASAWGPAYAGSIGLHSDANKLTIGYSIAKPTTADRLREKIGKLLADAVETYNLRSVESCQCAQMVLAVQALGGHVDQQYAKGDGKRGSAEYVSRFEARQSGIRFGVNEALRLNISHPVTAQNTEDGAGRGGSIKLAFQPVAIEAS